MAFGIPNQADAGASALQSAVDAGDFDILVEAYNGDGVISGGAVTTSCGLALAVASGVAMVNGARVTIGSGTVTISTADACNPRIDLIHVTCGGTKTVTAGTAAAVPVYPAVPANSAVLAAVFVPAADTVIATAQIIDKRVIIQNIAAAGVADAIDLNLGTGADFRLRWSTGDADNHAAVVALGQSNQVLHIAESCDIATDWNVAANAADSEVWIHSSTTPATDYLAIGRHTGTIATIDVQGGTTLNLDIAGNTELTVTAAGLNVPANSDINFTGTTGTNDIALTNGLADALSITDGSADVVVVDTSTAGNVITFTSALTVGVDDTGHDVKFFGAAAGAFMLYDQSCDQLEIRGAAADAATSTGKLLLTTALTNINACDVIGSINFQAPLEAGSCDAILVAAGIRAVAQATFTCAVNATDLIFYTGHSEAAAERFRFTSQNEIGVAGANYGTDGQVLTSGGAGAAVAWEDAAAGGASIAIVLALS